MKQKTLSVFAMVLAIAGGNRASAQAKLQFEVASVRSIKSTPEEGLAHFHEMQHESLTHRLPAPASAAPVFSGSRVDMDGITMRDLIARAFGEDLGRIKTAEPPVLSRISQVRYVIHAIMPEGATRAQLPEMLRSLLRTRFHLEAKRTVEEQPVYALVTGKAGTKFGEPRDLDRSVCPEWRNDTVFSGAQMCVTEQGTGGSRVVVTIKTDSPYGPWQSSLGNNGYRTEFFRITMSQLAEYLTGRFASSGYSQVAADPVVDRTGVDGAWDVVLERTDTDPTTFPVVNYVEAATESYSAALGKIGLKLERAKAPFEQLVIEHVDTGPTEN